MKRTNIIEAGNDVARGIPGRRAAKRPEKTQMEKNLVVCIFVKNVAPIKPAIIMEIGYAKPKAIFSKLASPKTFAILSTTIRPRKYQERLLNNRAIAEVEP